jgi:ribosomal protein L20
MYAVNKTAVQKELNTHHVTHTLKTCSGFRGTEGQFKKASCEVSKGFHAIYGEKREAKREVMDC